MMDMELAKRMHAKLMADRAPQECLMNPGDALILVPLLLAAAKAPFLNDEFLKMAYRDLAHEFASGLAKRKGKRARDVYAALDGKDLAATKEFMLPQTNIEFRLSVRAFFLIVQAAQLLVANFPEVQRNVATALAQEFQNGIVAAYPAARELLEGGWDRSQDTVVPNESGGDLVQ